MELDNLLDNITPTIYRALKQSLELGKWPDGRRLTQAQKETTMQAIIYYEAQHLGEADRTGHIDRGSKEEGESCGSASPDQIKWVDG